MANLTVTIDEDLLRRARIRALQEGASVNSLLRDYLQAYAGIQECEDACREVLAMSSSATSGSGPTGRKWTRADSHDR